MRTKFLAAAETEFQNAVDSYNAQADGLGFEFEYQVEEALGRIQSYPEAWSPVSHRLRRCQVNRFPYSLIYQIRNRLIVIVALQHTHQKPGTWQPRLN